MQIYLPIAELSVNIFLVLGLGGAVGLLSGLFGVGGGFLLTPLLIFSGIPSSIAVATTASHITASSMSGAIAQWRKRAIDLKMAAVMTLGGIVGTIAGVWLFGVLRRAGQMDVVVSISYVLLLGTIGALMLRESLGTLRAARGGFAITARDFRIGTGIGDDQIGRFETRVQRIDVRARHAVGIEHARTDVFEVAVERIADAARGLNAEDIDGVRV